MDERLRFVARRLDGEKMAVLCREFGISRKTGYKIFCRYKDCGVEGLTDRLPLCIRRGPLSNLLQRGAERRWLAPERSHRRRVSSEEREVLLLNHV